MSLAIIGRGLFEAGGLEILPLTLEIDHAINNLKSWMAPVYTKLPAIAAPSTSEIQYEPLGVVLVIAPFNYPIYLALGPLLGAIAAGDCALLKPSELTKASEALLMKLVPQYLDNDCYKVIAGGIATTTHLLNQRWDKIFFTGSTRVGAVVLQAAVKHMTPVALELGGKSPTIIDQSVTDLDLVAKRVMWGKLINSGQVSNIFAFSCIDEFSVCAAMILNLPVFCISVNCIVCFEVCNTFIGLSASCKTYRQH